MRMAMPVEAVETMTAETIERQEILNTHTQTQFNSISDDS